MGVRWRKPGRAMTRLCVRENDKKHLIDLAMADVVWKCVDARLAKL